MPISRFRRARQRGVRALIWGYGLRALRGVSASAFLAFSITACTDVRPTIIGPETPPYESAPVRMFSSERFYTPQTAPQCKFLLDEYCNFLYSPEAQGNLEVKLAQTPIRILQGDTHNEFSQVFFHYSQAKLRNQKRLPADLKQILNRHAYFEKLRTFLDRRPRMKMTLSQRLTSEASDYELGFIWSMAINETVLLRLSNKVPGYHRIPDKIVPIEFELERKRLRRTLLSEIAQAIWWKDPNWEKVEIGFERLKSSFLKMIPQLDISAETVQDWSKRIREIRLELPGATPAIANDECSKTTANAYYYTYLNVITVCAGDFNSEDILQTIAHEMAHALGGDRTRYLYQSHSSFGQSLARLRAQVCEPKTFSCGEWNGYKKTFGEALTTLDGYEPDLPKFQQCLKRRPTTKELENTDMRRFAKVFAADRVSELASGDRFLRIMKPEIPMANGKKQKNLNYLNPCSYSLWSQGEEPLDDELTTLLYFTAEYRCSDETGPQRMKNAIEIAKEMTTRVLEKTIEMEGEFSSRDRLETEGFSSPPYERFADVVGSYALAELLKQIPERVHRQNVFLASSSWQCTKPSLASHFPEESEIENEYVFEEHTAGDERRKEIFSRPIRETIGCEKDFDFNECEIPFKTYK